MPPTPEEHTAITPKLKQQLQNMALQHGLQTLVSLLRDLYYESQARRQEMTFDDYCKTYHRVPQKKTVDDYLAEQLRPHVISIIDDYVDMARRTANAAAFLSSKASNAADAAVENVRRLLGC
jgi:hypothetical protein